MKFITTLILCVSANVLMAQKAENLFRQARLHYQNLEYDEALEDVNAALNKSKKYFDAFLLRSDIFYSLDDTSKAFADLKKTIEMFPTADQSYFKMGMIYLDHNQFDQAWNNFEKATELYKQDAEYFYYKAEAALKLEKLKDACIALNHGATKLKDEDCKEEFDKNCTDVDITPDKEEMPERKSLKELLQGK